MAFVVVAAAAHICLYSAASGRESRCDVAIERRCSPNPRDTTDRHRARVSGVGCRPRSSTR